MRTVSVMAALVLAVAGCCAVETSGTKGLSAERVAVLTANETVGFRNYGYYRLSSISIDGQSYALTKKPTRFRLTPGQHTIAIAIAPAIMLPPGARRFNALPGEEYSLIAYAHSGGISYDVRDANGKSVSEAVPRKLPLSTTSHPGTNPERLWPLSRCDTRPQEQ